MTSPYAAALRRAFELSLAYLDGVDEAPVANVVGAPELRARLDGPLPDTGVDASAAIEQLAAGVDGGLTASVGPRFFGWVMGGHLPAALAADWLTSTWD
ncbi:MAG TPA: hypothetical protein VG963_11605, partial [Polyangiaceae bacterium]|nr:hypothetical protein [Polyangiaceae bacterium]